MVEVAEAVKSCIARCRPCGLKTRQHLVYAPDRRANGMRQWRCSSCANLRIQLADCDDFESMCRSVLDEHLRKTGATVDYADALQSLSEEGWDLWSRWDPDKRVPFLAYAVGLLRLRVVNFYRQGMGRNGKKAHANAISLDNLTADDGSPNPDRTWAEGRLGVDPADRSTDLVWALRR